MATAPDFYTKQQVLQKTTLSDTTLWRRVKAGEFPKAVRLSARRVAWPRVAVDQWVADKTAETV